MKKFKLLVLGIAMAFGIVSCGSSTTKSADDGKKIVGFSVSTLNNPFFVTLTESAKEKAKELNLDLIVVNAGDDTAKQTNDIEDLISKNIDVLVVNPVDSDAVSSAVSEAVDKGIKTISVDRNVNGVEVNSAIASDNVLGAELATKYLTELVGKGSKVAELRGVEGTSAARDRGQGFHNVADKDLNVVSSQTANFNRVEGLSVTENMLQANPDIKGIFAHNDEMALGAIEALNGKEIFVVGFDATEDATKAVSEKKMAATVAQKPDLMGQKAIETANKLLNGESVDKVIAVEVELIK